MPDSHIAICGTGRAGTTLLVRILRKAGLDTGFSDDDVEMTLSHPSNAGLERTPRKRKMAEMPDVIKSPHLFEFAGTGLREGWLKLDLMIVPVRDIDKVVKSRTSVTRMNLLQYFTKASQRGTSLRGNGGLIRGRRNIFRQREAVLDMFFQNIFLAVENDVSIVFLSFPRFARDADYFMSALLPALSAIRDIDADKLREAHASESDTSLIRR